MDLDIEKILKLSCLKADEKQRKILKEDLEKILGFFDQIKELKVEDQLKTEQSAFLRPDKLQEDKRYKEGLDSSKMKGDYFKTPPVLK